MSSGIKRLKIPEACKSCLLNTGCPLSKFRSMPWKILQLLVSGGNEEEQKAFYNYILQYSVKSEANINDIKRAEQEG